MERPEAYVPRNAQKHRCDRAWDYRSRRGREPAAERVSSLCLEPVAAFRSEFYRVARGGS